MSDSNFSDFRSFFAYFAGHRDFDYEFFVKKHLLYIKYLNELNREIPTGKERSYANMNPPVKLGVNYVFHLAYAKAFDIL